MPGIHNGIGTTFRSSAFGGAAPVNPNFISTWDTTKAGSASDTVVLPLLSGGTYSGTIDWGDGSSDDLSYANRTHTYAAGGTYTITISGSDIQGWRFANGGDRRKITDIFNWGTLNITTDQAFYGCSNLDVTATDAPIISTTDLSRTFKGCTIFNGEVDGWNMTGVQNLRGFFAQCSAFNQPVNSWDVSSVIYVADLGAGQQDGIFQGATVFDQPVDNWDTSNFNSLRQAFTDAAAFNQPLNTWVTTSVTNMLWTFYRAYKFNQPLSSWNTSNVLTMFGMFQNKNAIGSGNFFDQDISSWDINQVSAFGTNFMSFNTLSTSNYDALLIAWDAQGAMSFTGTVNFGSSKYTAGGAAEAARTSLISKWGGIIDGGAA